MSVSMNPAAAPMQRSLSERFSGFLPAINVATANLNTALTAAGAFVITPAILTGLGDSAYGGWLLMNSVVGYLRLLDQGTSTGTMKLGAGALARHDQVETRRVFSTSAAMFAGAGVLALLGSAVLALALPRYYQGIVGDNQWPIFILGLATALDLLLRVFPSSLRARSLFAVVDGIEIVTYSIFKLGLVLYLSQSLSYTVLSWLVLAETIARNGLTFFVSRAYCPFVRDIRPWEVDRAVLRQLLAMSGALSILLVADVVRFQLDAGILGYFMPDDPLAISIFGIGQRLPSIAFSVVGVIGAVLVPRFSGLSELGRHDDVRDLLRKASLANGLASAYVFINCAVLGPRFLEVWLGKPWVVESGQILLLMAPAYFVALQGGPAAALLIARGRLRGQVVITIVEAVANFVLSVLLVQQYGVMGAAVGTIVPMFIVRGPAFAWVVRQELGIGFGEYFRLHARAMAIGGIYLLLVVGIAWIPFATYREFVLLGLGSTAIFCLLLTFLPEARQLVRGRLASK